MARGFDGSPGRERGAPSRRASPRDSRRAVEAGEWPRRSAGSRRVSGLAVEEVFELERIDPNGAADVERGQGALGYQAADCLLGDVQLRGRLGDGQKELRNCGRHNILQFYLCERSNYRRVTMLASAQAPLRERNFRSGTNDPMIRPKRELALEPVRIVVELRQEEFQTLNAAIGPWVAPADYLRILALRVIAEAEYDLEP
jgi:hypothetical protein